MSHAATTAALSPLVFVSYSSHDKRWADAACAVLESNGIRCWIAPRDVAPFVEWGDSIIAGIDACRAMVVILSKNANQSPHVRREVERAISKGLVMMTCRIDDVAPAGSLEFALSNTHWFDAFAIPADQAMRRLSDAVLSELKSSASHALGPAEAGDQKAIHTDARSDYSRVPSNSTRSESKNGNERFSPEFGGGKVTHPDRPAISSADVPTIVPARRSDHPDSTALEKRIAVNVKAAIRGSPRLVAILTLVVVLAAVCVTWFLRPVTMPSVSFAKVIVAMPVESDTQINNIVDEFLSRASDGGEFQFVFRGESQPMTTGVSDPHFEVTSNDNDARIEVQGIVEREIEDVKDGGVWGDAGGLVMEPALLTPPPVRIATSKKRLEAGERLHLVIGVQTGRTIPSQPEDVWNFQESLRRSLELKRVR